MPIRQPPMDAAALDRFERLDHGARCHRPNLSVSRATDADGCFVPLTVLRSRAPISEARPEDLDADDPYVRLRCADGEPPHPDQGSPTCADGSVPMAWRDVARGIAEGDRYTERVCAARRYLYAHLDAAGREAFADGFEACGIP